MGTMEYKGYRGAVRYSAEKSVNAWIGDTLEEATKPARSDTARGQGKRRTAARKAAG